MSKYKVSPFAPESFPKLPPLAGFEMATAEAGVKYEGRTDLWVLRAQPGTQVAGVFTQNLCPGAPVDWSRKALMTETDDSRLVVVNSGTANVFGGQKSRDAVIETAKGVAAQFGCLPESVFLASTGVTTDTHPKGATATAKIDGIDIHINGIAKGSGMIAPDMATMLSFVGTDAKIAQPVLQELLAELTQTTFNAITVDSDTSTSDTLLLLASGGANNAEIKDVSDPRLGEFKAALEHVLHDLAIQVIKDGEGITKFVTIDVSGAVSDKSAKRVGMSIANSPLVKTAIAGEDANWGRIVMAVGKAGEPAERDKLSIWMGPHLLAERGQVASDYTEEAGAAYMKQDQIDIKVDLGLGEGIAKVYTCDLTHGYIEINADYRS